MSRHLILFAGLSLVPPGALLAQSQAQVEVDATAILHAVDRRIYGEHLENFGRMINGGLWAEMLKNRKFFPNDPSRSNVAEPWRAEASRDHVSYVIDRSISLDGRSSQRVSLFGDDHSWRGVRQGGLDVRSGTAYTAYAWIRSQPVSGAVSFRLEASDGTTVAHAETNLLSGDWHKYEARLTPDRDLTGATFRIAFDGSGANWIGAASLMPADNINGLRRDVVDAVRQLGPTLFRWPGGGSTDLYDWRNGIGARDRRPVSENGADANDFGTDEFLRFCELVGAQPYISVNYGSGTPEMAAQWVEYANGAAGTKWGEKRAANGHPKPYTVKNWLVGNETWSAYSAGYTNGEGYATYFVPIARAMRAVDRSVQVTALGLYEDRKDSTWNQKVLEHAWKDMDMLSLHHYFPPAGIVPPVFENNPLAFYKAIVAEPTGVEIQLRRVLALADRISGGQKRIGISLDEWNEWDMPKMPPDNSGKSAMNQLIDFILKTALDFNQTERDGMYGARIMHVLMRLGDRAPIAARTHVINSLGAIRTDSTRSFITASGKAMELYRNHSGTLLAKTEQSSAKFDLPEMKWNGIPVLDATATLSEDKRKLFVHLINLDAASPLPVRVTIKSAGVAPRGVAWQIAPEDYLARNDFTSTPVDIKKLERDGFGPDFAETLPPHSMTILELELNSSR
jgi:alpha-N-arabinofuranosidase